MCICICVYIYIYIYICICICVYIYIYICIFVIKGMYCSDGFTQLSQENTLGNSMSYSLAKPLTTLKTPKYYTFP